MTNTKKVFYWLFEFIDEHSFCIITKKGNQYSCMLNGKGEWYINVATKFNPRNQFKKKQSLKLEIAKVLYAWREDKGIEYKTLRDKKNIPPKVLEFIETIE